MTLVPGTFTARAVEGALGETSNGSPQIAVELQVLDDGYTGETITWFGYFTEKTTARTMESLRILGWKTDDLSNLDGITENEVKIVVVEDEYDGKTRLKVNWINRPGGLALKSPMTPDKARGFAAQMKGAAVLSRGSAPKPAGRPAPPGATRYGTSGHGANLKHTTTPEQERSMGGGTEDEIPF